MYINSYRNLIVYFKKNGIESEVVFNVFAFKQSKWYQIMSDYDYYLWNWHKRFGILIIL